MVIKLRSLLASKWLGNAISNYQRIPVNLNKNRILFAPELARYLHQESRTPPPLLSPELPILQFNLLSINNHKIYGPKPNSRIVPIGNPLSQIINPIEAPSSRKQDDIIIIVPEKIQKIIEDKPKEIIEKKANTANVYKRPKIRWNYVHWTQKYGLLVIRRWKMNKHKLNKLRVRMGKRWTRIKFNRMIRREKAFLNNRVAEIKEAERFDPQKYVANIIAKAKDVPLPERWYGVKRPTWFILQEMDKEKKKTEYNKIWSIYKEKTNLSK